MSIEISSGTLYIVATPIGNFGDISQRAIDTLSSVDLIAAEDTRHSQNLLSHHGVNARLQSYHEHNEQQQAPKLIQQLQQGMSIALISDAGTPLVNDPGYRLVERAYNEGIRVVPVPGACAAIAALCAAGLATDRFVFEGFPPAKQGARLNYLQTLQNEERTMVFYVSCHKIVETLKDMQTVFGGERVVTFARELTKVYETLHKTTLAQLCEWVQDDLNQTKGEIVLVIAGQSTHMARPDEVNNILSLLVVELPVKQAAKITAKLTGANKNELYKLALELKHKMDTSS